MRPCFKFTAKAGDKPAVLAIDEEIGFWGLQAKDFRAQLDAVEGDELVVEINSVGGEVMAGLGMYNMLRSWAKDGKKVTTRVTGLAASISSLIALAGDRREAPENAFVMIHSPSTFAWGTEEDLREAADVVAKIKGSMRKVYVDRMGATEAKVDELLAKDSWLTAAEAKEIGFITDITDAVEATAKYDVSKLDLPKGATLFTAKKPEPASKSEPSLIDQITALAKDAGFEALAADFALQCETLDAAKARITAAKDIQVYCTLAGEKDKAASFIKAGKTAAEVRAALLKARAKDDPEIDNAPPEKPPVQAEASVNPTKTWAKLRAQREQAAKGR